MPYFNIMNPELIMSDEYSRADMQQIPSHPGATIAMAHEYTHFVQAMSSTAGLECNVSQQMRHSTAWQKVTVGPSGI
jgi:hypothetical protein